MNPSADTGLATTMWPKLVDHYTSDAGEIVKWTISLGISALPVNKRSANTIEIVMEMFIHQADSALYEAKNKGRNQTVLSQQNTL